MRRKIIWAWWGITNWLYNTYQDFKEWFMGMPVEAEGQ